MAAVCNDFLVGVSYLAKFHCLLQLVWSLCENESIQCYFRYKELDVFTNAMRISFNSFNFCFR